MRALARGAEQPTRCTLICGALSISRPNQLEASGMTTSGPRVGSHSTGRANLRAGYNLTHGCAKSSASRSSSLAPARHAIWSEPLCGAREVCPKRPRLPSPLVEGGCNSCLLPESQPSAPLRAIWSRCKVDHDESNRSDKSTKTIHSDSGFQHNRRSPVTPNKRTQTRARTHTSKRTQTRTGRSCSRPSPPLSVRAIARRKLRANNRILGADSF